MNIIITLQGEDYEAEKQLISAEIDANPWFVLDNMEVGLDEYLTNLHDQYDLPNRVLARLKICRNIEWAGGDVRVIAADGRQYLPVSIIGLLREFPPLSPGSAPGQVIANIIIENDDRKLLANIAQQFIYLDCPLSKIDIRRRKDFKNAASVKKLEENIDNLANATARALADLEAIAVPTGKQNSPDMLECKNGALASFRDIQAKVDEARKVEMKVAVAASKKTGKSVIVNCLLGQELAPTSLEMATPNTCVYKKSKDGKYHLLWDKKSDLFDASIFKDYECGTPEELYRKINSVFKEAQKDKSRQFRIPDMVIEYASNLNNFESYTIYDTPGPDASGTSHKVSAERAMQECDASIFAIDYSKYLTVDEKKYLDKVRHVFSEKNKFFTLIFDLNKMDLALQDSGAHSRVKSIDFIRNRLMEIDRKYEDCILFASSALDYFNTLLLEQGAQKTPQLQKLLEPGSNWIRDAREAIYDLEDAGVKISEKETTALANLDAEAGKLKTMLGYKKANLESFREFSGMPQLMGYLGYILQSRAREEIVNYISVTIDALSGKIDNITNKSANILDALNWNREQIERISKIIESYVARVTEALSENITAEDLEIATRDGFTISLIEHYMAPGEMVTFDNLSSAAEKALQNLIDGNELKKDLWNTYESIHLAHLKELKKHGVIRPDRVNLAPDKVRTLIDSKLRESSAKTKNKMQETLNIMANDLKNILESRFQRIQAISAECRRQLDKEKCNVKLPELPTFAVDFPEPTIPDFKLKIGILEDNMRGRFDSISFAERIGENIKRHGLNIFAYEDLTGMINLKNYDEKTLKDKIQLEHKPFYDMLDDCLLLDMAEKISLDISNLVMGSIIKLLRDFHHLVEICRTSVAEFAKIVDERAYYEGRSAELREFLEVINRIDLASKDFKQIWASIKPEPESAGVAQ